VRRPRRIADGALRGGDPFARAGRRPAQGLNVSAIVEIENTLAV
jgi:hypothetical protein